MIVRGIAYLFPNKSVWVSAEETGLSEQILFDVFAQGERIGKRKRSGGLSRRVLINF